MSDQTQRTGGLDRRSFLRFGAIGVGAAAIFPHIATAGWGSRPGAQILSDVPGGATRKRVLRVAHLTDMHVQPELGANEGLIACLRHLANQKDKPDLVLTGGDHVMDIFDTGRERAVELTSLYHKIMQDECGSKVHSCIGNHDIWGWGKKKSGTKGDEDKWGKKWSTELLRLNDRYYTFDQSGWRFFVIDSVHPDGEGYTALLDEAQMGWLKDQFKALPVGMPALVLSHIPIMSIASFEGTGDPQKNKEYKISGSKIHRDWNQLGIAFRETHARCGTGAGVRACLSGHLHQVDRVDYNGVSYLCNGAVSGAWWKGKNGECDNGYAMLNLFSDGTIEREYVTYGWVPRK
ncbi:MAG: metallophosphoesterase [Planctomycetes bacterium]|nr:metallophosphoesterase [Planctomycetota bacterium]